MDQTQQDIYMRELAVRVIVQGIEAQNTLLRKNAETGGREYEGVTLGAGLKWTGTTAALSILDAAGTRLGIDMTPAAWDYTDAGFGQTCGVYLGHYNPAIFFNCYSNAGAKYGVGSAGNYAACIFGDCINGGIKFQTTSAAGNANAAAILVERVRVSKDGDLVILDSAKGLVMKDTAGTPHYWRLSVETDGTLTTMDLGTTAPV
jgi:hypothetical protein